MTEFDNLNRQIPTLTRERDGKVPKLYIKTIADLETIMLETIEKQKVSPKKMNAVNTRGLNAMRQKLRRIVKDYADEVEAYRRDPEAYMREEIVEEAPPVPKKPKQSFLSAAEAITGADNEGFTEVDTRGRPVRYTPESILKNLRTIIEARGRKGTDRLESIRTMEKLLDVAVTDYQKVRVLLTLISTRFDLTSGTGTQMTQEQWKLAEHEFTMLLQILESNEDIVVIEGAEEWEDDEKQPQVPPADEDSGPFKIPGSIASFIERLDDELTRSLQHIDPHTAEYVERLTDETPLYTNIVRSLLYIERLRKNPKLDASQDSVNRVLMRRLEHIYFKVSNKHPLSFG